MRPRIRIQRQIDGTQQQLSRAGLRHGDSVETEVRRRRFAVGREASRKRRFC